MSEVVPVRHSPPPNAAYHWGLPDGCQLTQRGNRLAIEHLSPFAGYHVPFVSA